MKKNLWTSVVFFFVSVFVSGCSDRIPQTPQEKQSYAAGVRLAQTFQKNDIKLDHRMVEQAMRDVIGKKELKLSEQDLKTAELQLAEAVNKARFANADKNLKETEKHIESYLKDPNVKRTDSGLLYKVINKGKGPRPKQTDTVVVDYTGKTVDGLIFDSSIQRGKPAEFQLGGIIPGLREALTLMSVGSKYEVMIPPNLGYGTSGNSTIPSNSALIFELDLKSIKN